MVNGLQLPEICWIDKPPSDGHHRLKTTSVVIAYLPQHVLVLHVVRAEGLLPQILHAGVQAGVAGDLEETGVQAPPEPRRASY